MTVKKFFPNNILKVIENEIGLPRVMANSGLSEEMQVELSKTNSARSNDPVANLKTDHIGQIGYNLSTNKSINCNELKPSSINILKYMSL